ncbi:MAG TPA: superoxide dismutase family protein [Casimicrobiaceae bacterium]
MKSAFVSLAAVALLAGCSSMGSTPFDGPRAAATLEPTKGNRAAGTVTFVERMGQVVVTADITGLAPNQEHGFHVHDKGDCSSGDGMSAAGHFNPGGTPHGPQQGPRHGGDMPNLKADANGNARVSFTIDEVTVAAGPKSIVGRGLIVHKDPDDYKTQPTGNSGARLACGVIRAA